MKAFFRRLNILHREVRYLFFKLWQFIEKKFGETSLSELERLDEEKRLIHYYRLESRRFSWLNDALQDIPYWGRGHLEFAKNASILKEHSLAYASLLATLKLSPSKKNEAEALLMLSEVYTAKGGFLEALKILEGLSELQKSLQNKFIEAKAAALIGLGRNDEAYQLLSQIPVDERSPAVQAAVDFSSNEWRKD